MRTGIYVFAPTTLTIEASEPVVLTSLDNQSIALGGGTASTAVPPGIYKAVTSSAIAVTGPSIFVVGNQNNRDPWPDPPLDVPSRFNVTAANLNAFVAVPDVDSAAS